MKMPGLTLLFAVVFAIGCSLCNPLPAFAAVGTTTVPAVLPGLNGVFTGTRPDGLGVIDGQLAACPSTPNCVVSQNADSDHAIAPIAYTTDRAQAQETLLAVIQNQPRVNIVEQTDNYIAVEFTSKLMGFVDDAEFYFPETEPVIQMRSAARLGESDLGVNRRRLEQFRLALQTLGA